MKFGIVSRLVLCVIFLVISGLSANTLGDDIKVKVAQATQGYRDLKLTCIVKHANISELRKISADFSQRYEFKKTTLMYKSPDKLKIEGKLGMVKMKIVINGDQKALVIPSVRYSKKENIKNDPHKRQSDLDAGVFSDSFWNDYIVSKVENEKDSDCSMYKITFYRENAKEKKLICWVDVDSLKLYKLESFYTNGEKKVRYSFSRHIKAGNRIWVPMKMDIYNGEGKHAASVEYDDVEINTGITDSEFKF